MNLFFTNVAHASLSSFVGNVNKLIINPIIVLLFALAMVYFLFGLFEFISNAENEEKRTKGKSHMLWGIVGIVIMMAVWTLLGIITKTFNITDIDPSANNIDDTVELEDYNPSSPWVTP